MEIETLYENADARIIAFGNDSSDETWYMFGAHSNRKEFAVGLISERNCYAVQILSFVDDWYQSEASREAIDVLRAIRDKREGKVILFGASMGGFCALENSARLRADIVFVGSPQVVIDPVEAATHDDRWIDTWYALAARGFRVADASTGLSPTARHIILYDPLIKSDRWHVSRILSHPTAEPCEMRFSGHTVFDALRSMGLWFAFVDSVVKDDREGTKRILLKTTQRKREAADYFNSMGLRLFKRGKTRLAEYMFQKSIDRDYLPGGNYFYLSICAQIRGDWDQALNFAKLCVSCSIERGMAGDHVFGGYVRIAHVHLATANYAGGCEALEKAMKVLPGDARGPFEYSFFLSHIPERNADALVLIEEALRLSPDNPNFKRHRKVLLSRLMDRETWNYSSACPGLLERTTWKSEFADRNDKQARESLAVD